MTTEKTPYAVTCPDHGQQFLTEREYDRQLTLSHIKWRCPLCKQESSWDDDNYDLYFKGVYHGS